MSSKKEGARRFPSLAKGEEFLLNLDRDVNNDMAFSVAVCGNKDVLVDHHVKESIDKNEAWVTSDRRITRITRTRTGPEDEPRADRTFSSFEDKQELNLRTVKINAFKKLSIRDCQN